MLLSQRSEPLLLGRRIDVCSNEEPNKVEEWHPGLLRQELLCECEAQWRGNPADLHDWQETRLPSCVNLVDSASSGYDCHGDEVDAVLDRSNDEIADENLEDLRLQAGSPGEHFLEYADEDMAQRSTDECTICHHLWNPGCEVVSILVAILGNP